MTDKPNTEAAEGAKNNTGTTYMATPDSTDSANSETAADAPTNAAPADNDNTDSTTETPRPSKFALIIIFIISLIDSIGFGIILPVTPGLLMEISGEDLGSSAVYGGWLLFAYAAMQFFFAPVLGNLSDAYGRRPVLLISLLLVAGNYMLMGLADTLLLLFIGRIVSGIGAGTWSTCNAYIADTVPVEERAQYFGLLGAAFGLGFVIGPVLGGFLAEFGSRVPFFATGYMAFASLLFGFFLLPESLKQENRRRFEPSRANPFAALQQMSKFKVVFGILGVMFLYNLGHHVLPSIWNFYGIERYDWTPREVGYSLGFVGILMVLVQGFLIRLVIPMLGQRMAGLTGLAFTLLGFVAVTLAFDPWLAYLALLPMSLGGLATPAIHGLASSQIGPDQQGELQGTLASMVSLTAIISPPLMTMTFNAFSGDNAIAYIPGAPFLLAAALTLLALALFMRTTSNLAQAVATNKPS